MYSRNWGSSNWNGISMGFKISDMGHFQVMIEVGVEVGSCSFGIPEDRRFEA